MVGPSAMNKQVTFYSPAARNTDGSSNGNPAASFSTWAAIFALAGAEIDRAQQIAQRVSHVVLIPYQSAGVQANMTIQYLDGGQKRNFQIAAIDDPDEQRWGLKIYCFEIGQNAGQAS
jgi:SPP1 family predicted phage head-tail adaptor